MPEATAGCRIAFRIACAEAEGLGSAEVDVEHLVLGLLKLTPDWPLPAALGRALASGEVEALGREIAALHDPLRAGGLDPVAARRGLRALCRQAAPARPFSGHRTPRCRELFARAEARGRLDLPSLWRAALETPAPLLDRLWEELGLSPERVATPAPGDEAPPPAARPEPGSSQPTDWLRRYGRDLTRLAREGSLQPAIGREEETKRVARILLQAKKHSPILVGDPGVGKTAIVEGLARLLAGAEVPPPLRGLRLVELSLGALVSGTRHRGDFEERIQGVLRAAEEDRSLILFIDEVHMLLGAGDPSGGSMDAANLLKPALARGTLRLIGATTTAEYRRHIEKDPALERRFQVVWVEEPTREAAVAILTVLRPKLEAHHGVAIAPRAVERAVELAIRYLPDLRLPDKAIDLLDQSCARALLSTLRASAPGGPRTVGPEEVAAVVSERCRIPVERLSAEEGERLLGMEEALGRRVMGQPRAVAAVAEAVRTAKAGLKDPRRPVGVFLFLGPTGTGKTELAKALAEFLFADEGRLIRLDMSEYQLKESAARMIGAPPGYIGHEAGGQLTDAIRAQPFSVVLFDEIEKAHPDVFDLFLQMLDEGRLTDSRGRTASFREAVIILTSNLGSGPTEAERIRPLGFTPGQPEAGGTEATAPPEPDASPEAWAAYEGHHRQAAARFLRPELLNRIQRLVCFAPLGGAAVRAILDQLLARVTARLSERRIALDLDQAAYALLMRRGFDPAFGAREMERTVERLLVQPLAHAVLAGGIPDGARVRVRGGAEALALEVPAP